ncbi:hypothetical protein MINTM001_43650 [Mycobacterium paraintracellulare]|nr:hypothetical protein MINTM001_43650 [Mycobacterium paraintracellulare]
MKSTMWEAPLLVTEILRHGTTVCAEQTVTTATVDGYREARFDDIGCRAAQLAHGLRSLGISGDQRVATFMWNNQEHLEAFFAVPCMGAVLHTLNIRLPSEQISYIANQAEDRVLTSIFLEVGWLLSIGRLLPVRWVGRGASPALGRRFSWVLGRRDVVVNSIECGEVSLTPGQ